MEHLSLLALNKTIGEVLAKNLEPSYWVVAEIGEMRHNRNGHCYLELVEKDSDNILAKSRATIWSYTYRNLSAWFLSITGQDLKPGMKILFNATVQFHEIYGFSLNIKDIDAQYILGERAKRKQEIIQKLQDDGVFEMNKEIDLPLVPQKIAVISSESAAGYGDFMDQLNDNEYGYHFDVRLFNSTMQGNKAELSILNSIHLVFDQLDDFDLLVIIRGGGAATDLDCFDSYELGSHIAQFPLPIVTGIGHERDETIADLVAHTKMKTPTAVAEFIIMGSRNFEEKLNEHFDQLANRLNFSLVEENNKMDQVIYQMQRNVQAIVNKENIGLAGLIQSLNYSRKKLLDKNEHILEENLQKIVNYPARLLEREGNKLEHLGRELEIINPINILKRGYSITLVDGVNINKLDSLEKDATINTITKRLEIESKLLSQKKK